MNRLAPLTVLAASLCLGSPPCLARMVSPPAQDVAQPSGGQVVPTREALVDALVEIGRERDELRAALGAAQAEIARSRASYDVQRGNLAACESRLEQSLNLGEALMRSHATMSGLLSQERKAASRARWTEVFRVGLPWMAGGYIAAELTGD